MFQYLRDVLKQKGIQILVTEADIENGKRANHLECPIAIAIRRQFPEERVSVAPKMIHIGEDFYHSRKADKFIHNFDNKKTVKPFSFVLKEGIGE